MEKTPTPNSYPLTNLSTIIPGGIVTYAKGGPVTTSTDDTDFRNVSRTQQACEEWVEQVDAAIWGGTLTRLSAQASSTKNGNLDLKDLEAASYWFVQLVRTTALIWQPGIEAVEISIRIVERPNAKPIEFAIQGRTSDEATVFCNNFRDGLSAIVEYGTAMFSILYDDNPEWWEACGLRLFECRWQVARPSLQQVDHAWRDLNRVIAQRLFNDGQKPALRHASRPNRSHRRRGR